MEGLVVVPPLEDHSLLGITSPDHVHFITAGAKGRVTRDRLVLVIEIMLL